MRATPWPSSAAVMPWVSSENISPALTSSPDTWTWRCQAAQSNGAGDEKWSSVWRTSSAGSRHAVLLSSRGGYDFDPGRPLAALNHLEPSVRTALQFIGIGRFHDIAIEHQEEGGDVLAASVDSALARIDRLVDRLHAEMVTPGVALPA